MKAAALGIVVAPMIAFAQPVLETGRDGLTAEVNLGPALARYAATDLELASTSTTNAGYLIGGSAGWFVEDSFALIVRLSREAGADKRLTAIGPGFQWWIGERAWTGITLGASITEGAIGHDFERIIDVGVGGTWRLGMSFPASSSHRDLWSISLEGHVVDPATHVRGAIAVGFMAGYQHL